MRRNERGRELERKLLVLICASVRQVFQFLWNRRAVHWRSENFARHDADVPRGLVCLTRYSERAGFLDRELFWYWEAFRYLKGGSRVISLANLKAEAEIVL